jgi:hypothetical protein
MDIEQKIEQIKMALAAVDNAIAQTESALKSSATIAEDVRALRARLIDLQGQRSQLSTDLINLQAAQTVVPENMASAADVKAVLPERKPRKLTIARAKEIKSIHTSLDSSIVDRSVVQATLDHATNVSALVKRLREIS